MRFGSTDHMPFGKTSESACLMTVVSTGPAELVGLAATNRTGTIVEPFPMI
jgi:hypothetical protein